MWCSTHLCGCFMLNIRDTTLPLWPNSGIRVEILQEFDWLLVSKVFLTKGVQAACSIVNMMVQVQVYVDERAFTWGGAHNELMDSHLRAEIVVKQVRVGSPKLFQMWVRSFILLINSMPYYRFRCGVKLTCMIIISPMWVILRASLVTRHDWNPYFELPLNTNWSSHYYILFLIGLSSPNKDSNFI